MIVREPDLGKEYNCLDTDLVDGFPPTEGYELGDTIIVYNSSNQLVEMFELINVGNGSEWMQLL